MATMAEALKTVQTSRNSQKCRKLSPICLTMGKTTDLSASSGSRARARAGFLRCTQSSGVVVLVGFVRRRFSADFRALLDPLGEIPRLVSTF